MSEPGHQPKEYIITEEDLTKIDDFARTQQLKEFRNVLITIRSRPHPSPAPELSKDTLHCDCMGCKDEVAEHDARIAAEATAAERERWITAFNTLIATESKRPSKDFVDMVYSYRIAQTIESLLSQP